MCIIDETQEAEGMQIFIGSENNLFGLTDCSTIISPFRNKDKEIIGAIGVIGPMRINYAKIIPVVDYTAKLIGENWIFSAKPTNNFTNLGSTSTITLAPLSIIKLTNLIKCI